MRERPALRDALIALAALVVVLAIPFVHRSPAFEDFVIRVSAMALYPYIAGRPELVELMFDAVAGQAYAGAELPAQKGEWPDRLRHIAAVNWAHLLRHPWIVDVRPGRPVPGPRPG